MTRRSQQRSWFGRMALCIRCGIIVLVRVIFVCLCVVGPIALLLYTIDRPNLRLDATLVPGLVITAAFLAALLACVLRYSLAGKDLVMDEERTVIARILARLPCASSEPARFHGSVHRVWRSGREGPEVEGYCAGGPGRSAWGNLVERWGPK